MLRFIFVFEELEAKDFERSSSVSSNPQVRSGVNERVQKGQQKIKNKGGCRGDDDV